MNILAIESNHSSVHKWCKFVICEGFLFTDLSMPLMENDLYRDNEKNLITNAQLIFSIASIYHSIIIIYLL